FIVHPHSDQILDQDFWVTNPSQNEEMTLTSVQRNCSCIDLNVDPETISPFGKARISFRVAPRAVTGVNRIQLSFNTGLKERPILEFIVSIHTLASLEVEPQTFQFTCLRPGENKIINFRVTAHRRVQDKSRKIMAKSIEGDLKINLERQEEHVQNDI